MHKKAMVHRTLHPESLSPQKAPDPRYSIKYQQFDVDTDIFIIVRVEEFSLVISVENALYLKSFPHLALC